jgi:hypothetical protein
MPDLHRKLGGNAGSDQDEREYTRQNRDHPDKARDNPSADAEDGRHGEKGQEILCLGHEENARDQGCRRDPSAAIVPLIIQEAGKRDGRF